MRTRYAAASFSFLLAIGALSGCGGSHSDPPLAVSSNAIRVSSGGTDGFVPVGTTGVSVSVPPGAFTEPTTVTITPINQVPNTVVPAGDSFITGLQVGTFITPIEPVQVQVPLPGTTTTNASISVLQQVNANASVTPVASATSGSTVTFSASQSATFVVTSH